MALPTLSLLCLLPLAYGVTVGTSGTSAGLLVCKNKPCKKSGALDTFDSLFALATASEQANAKSSPSVAQASLQASFAAARIASSGCLAHCGSGPNCAVDNAPEDVLHDVYKPASCVALLSHVGIDVPEAAQKAWLRRMYAMRAMRSNKPAEAVSLLTEALNEAGALKQSGAYMLALLLDQRADAHDELRDAPKAEADRARAQQMRSMTLGKQKAASGAAS